MNNRREQLSPFVVVVLLGACVAVGLTAAFQHESYQEDYYSGEPASELTVSYLEAWLRLEPDSTQRLVLLGEQYLKLDRRESALALARHIEQLDGASEELLRQALYLRVNIAEHQAYELSEADSQREERMQEYRDQLAATQAYSWPLSRQQLFAQMAWQAGAYDVALHYYQLLAISDTDNALDWHLRTGDLAFARQEYEAAADSYFAAAKLSGDMTQKRTYFLRALGVLESGDRAPLACTLAEEHVQGLENDRDVVIYLLNLARMANRADLVDKYAQKLASLLELGQVQPPLKQPLARMFSVQGLLPALVTGLQEWPERLIHSAYRAIQVEASRYPVFGVLLNGVRMTHELQVASTSTGSGNGNTASTAAAGEQSNDHDLLYQVYVESGKLTKAKEIALKALSRGLDARIWEARLAQVAEWAGDPVLALQAWNRHAQLTDAPVSWENVRRLSIGLNDDTRYLQALEFSIRNTPNNAALYDELVLAHERQGDPEHAMRFLEAQAVASRSKVLLQRYAELAERAGHDEKARLSYQRLMQIDPTSRALHSAGAARLHYKQGEMESALQLLRSEAALAPVSAESAPFWRLYGEVARLLQQDDDANRAYQGLLATEEATAADFAAMTYFYIHSPVDAARVAEVYLQQNPDVPAAIETALFNYAEIRAWSRINYIISNLTDEQREQLGRSVHARLVRARYYLYEHRWSEAMADFREAVNLAPNSDDIRIAYLWVLVEYGTEDELSRRLHEWRKLLRLNSDYREVFAAGYMRLGQARRAVSLMRKQPPEVQKDPLWIMSLADAEQQNGHEKLAAKLYRQAWLELHVRLQLPEADESILPTPVDEQLSLWQARAILAGRLLNAERSNRALERMLAEDYRLMAPGARQQSRLGEVGMLRPTTEVMADTPTTEGQPSPGSVHAAVGLAIDRHSLERARQLLQHPAVRGLPASADYEMSLALNEEDATRAAALLETRRGRISFYNRVSALGDNRRTSEQENLLFDSLSAAPDSDAMHQDLTDVIWADKSALGISLRNWRSEALNINELDVFARLKLTNRYGITLHSIARRQNIRRKQDIAWAPSTDNEYEISLHDRTVEHEYTLTLGQRSGYKSFATGRIFAEINRHGTWVPSATLGWRQYTSLSPYLQVAGYKNMLDLGLSWQPDNSRWFANANAEVARFYTQKHDAVARGTEFNQELGYRIYHAYPDWNVRLVAGQGNYSASGKSKSHPALARMNPDAVAPTNRELVPENFRRYGIMTGFGNSDFTTRKSSWKPFADFGYIRDNKNGRGPVVSVGIGGPVLGGDHLVLQYLHEATGARNRQRTNQLLISYYLNF